ncbi:MAG: leucine-rich repeat domain-containing protein [Bacteroidales bacterium]|nr:leucine-rich repeat domain-containing protein [Bacteroidales bacterium]
MDIKKLNHSLQEAYTTENLNKISLTLINLYKNQQYSALQKIADLISDSVSIEITNDGKGFSKFMMLYHPDRISHHINEIEKLTEQNNFEGLLGYSHILLLGQIEEIAAGFDGYEDIDYSPVYEWDIDMEGFSIVNDFKEEAETNNSSEQSNFFDAFKKRVYDNTSIEIPTYYLEDIEEFELSSSGIDDLDGAEYCIHAKIMDLSENMIYDLIPLWGLSLLEELNLSDNRLEEIDVLSKLVNLKRLYLANNDIRDISPLFELSKLEYVDLTGNIISMDQIEKLTELEIDVDY